MTGLAEKVYTFMLMGLNIKVNGMKISSMDMALKLGLIKRNMKVNII